MKSVSNKVIRNVKTIAIISSLTGIMLLFQNCTNQGLSTKVGAGGQGSLEPAGTDISSSSLLAQVVQLAEGNWGANGANFIVSDQGAFLDFGCAVAQIPNRILLDKNGEFEMDGTYQNQGGAQPVDGYPLYRARFHGSVDGKLLKLDYTVEGHSDKNSLVLTFDFVARLFRCL